MPSQMMLAAAHDADAAASGDISTRIQYCGTPVYAADIETSTWKRKRWQGAGQPSVDTEFDLVYQEPPSTLLYVMVTGVQSVVWDPDACTRALVSDPPVYAALPSSLSSVSASGVSPEPALRTWIGIVHRLSEGLYWEAGQGVEAVTEGSRAEQLVAVEYEGWEELQELLGGKAFGAVREAVDLTKSVSLRRGWPLRSIRISVQVDPEVDSWRYALIVLSFGGSFEQADAFLHELYDDLDRLAGRLDSDARDIFDRKVFFDISSATV